jgi:glycosyltransferase involved in cell wall biosynthesis
MPMGGGLIYDCDRRFGTCSPDSLQWYSAPGPGKPIVFGRSIEEVEFRADELPAMRPEIILQPVQDMLNPMRQTIGIFCPDDGAGPWRYIHSIISGIEREEFDVLLFRELPGEYEEKPWIKVVPLGEPKVSRTVSSPKDRVAVESPRIPSYFRRFTPEALRIWAGFGKQVGQYARLIRRHPVSLFHTHRTGCEESPVAAKLSGVPHVLGTFHVDPTYDLHRIRSGPVHRMLEILSNCCLDVGLAVSHSTKRDWVRRTHISPKRVVTIHNGIDTEKFRRRQSKQHARRMLGLPETGLIVGGLGRLVEVKGFTYLINAAAKIRSDVPDLFVAIAGSGPLQNELEAEASRLGINDCVKFMGFHADVQPFLDSLDVFVLPSVSEALGYALLEAMATEVVSVGSSVGGVPEVIVPGETGFLVPPRNSTRLAESLRLLLRNPELRRTMGVASRKRIISTFQERDMVRKTIDIYRNLLYRSKCRKPSHW